MISKFLSFLLFLMPVTVLSQPPCPPFTPCWCVDHPTHPACRDIGIPISDWYGEIILLLLVTLLIYFYITPQIKKNITNQK